MPFVLKGNAVSLIYSIQVIWGNRDDVQSWSSFAHLNPSGMWIENIKEAHINYRKKNKKNGVFIIDPKY